MTTADPKRLFTRRAQSWRARAFSLGDRRAFVRNAGARHWAMEWALFLDQGREAEGISVTALSHWPPQAPPSPDTPVKVIAATTGGGYSEYVLSKANERRQPDERADD
jgi:hypothetical protein